MEPVSKGLKLSGERDTRIHDVDRISNLPDDLIGNILSFLPTEEAVATSVLSPRWKWSWTFITRLHFVDKFPSFDDEESEDQIELQKASFISYVDRVVFYCKPTPLSYFGVTCHREYCASHLRAWLSVVLPVGVKELDISISFMKGDRHVLPSDLFCCKTLVKLKLKLRWRFKIDIPIIVCLPSLEVLTLDGVGFCDDDDLNRLLVGCPAIKEFESNYCQRTPSKLFSSCRKLVKLILGDDFVMNPPPTLVSLPSLEALHLNGVEFPDNDSLKRLLLGCPSLRELILTTFDAKATVLDIDAPVLSDLTISLESQRGVLHSKVVLDTPSLQYLKVDALAAKRFEVADLSQLVVADISRIYPGIEVASDLISAVSKVQTLYLSAYILEVIAKHGCKLPKFHNMTTLKLGVGKKAGWALIPDLVKNALVLETLVFKDELWGSKYSTDPTSFWYAPKIARFSSACHYHVKLIQEMFKYLNENREILKDLTIQYPGWWEVDEQDKTSKGAVEAKTSLHDL